ncbi:MAG TPA: M28 family peptidase [Oscillospiraceae bacterium]|nr:M28 family peptidase [Oscillospiraceae bacterium]HPK34953.1 M28 family peptidase [Oscillospiraceae bacterium]HPR75338.1 M28 family peptidase [Oscillospiraceae bacterium]
MEIHRCLGKNRNVIVGDLGKAKVIFTAHYDTPPKMAVPNFILPRSIGLSVLYQLILGVLMLAGFYVFLLAGGYMGAVISALVSKTADTSFITNFANILTGDTVNEAAVTFTTIGGFIGILLLGYLILGMPNRNNYNDNTSGVVALLEIAAKLPPELRREAAFVFFDREEWGTLGSLGFKKRYAKLLANKPVVNFDCVGDGETLAFLLKKDVGEDIEKKLKAADKGQREMIFFPSKTTFYPSDHANFRCGIGVAAFRKSRIFGYYLSRIHTKRDRFLNEKNVEALSDTMVRFLEAM